MSVEREERWWDGHLLTVREVADLLRVSKMTIHRLIQSGDLRAVRVRNGYRIPEKILHAYIEKGGGEST